MTRLRKSVMMNIITGGGVAITPASYAGLTSWHDASVASSMYTDAGTTPVTADADAVRQFDDLSAGTNYFVQAVAGARPLYKVNRQNGKSGLLFQGTDDQMTTSAQSALYAAGAKTVVYVFKNIAGTGGGIMGDASGFFGAYIVAGPALRLNNWDGAGDDADISITDNTACVVAMWHTRGNINIAKNNGAAVTVASGNTTNLTLADTIGQYAGAFGNFDFYERATYNVSLANADRTALVAALMTKWGIS